VLPERTQRTVKNLLGKRVTRFLIASAIAFGTSEIVLSILYVYGLPTTLCTIFAFVAGAIPNWAINRNWTWNVQGGVAVGREVVAYVLLSGATLTAQILAVNWTHDHVQGIQAGHGIRVLLIDATYLAVLVIMYGIRFLVYEHWIFSGRSLRAALRSRRQVWMAARANRTP
jgi:putative flippase GtrA